MELPLKIEYEGEEFWIKKATKTTGIYMNKDAPKERKPYDIKSKH